VTKIDGRVVRLSLCSGTREKSGVRDYMAEEDDCVWCAARVRGCEVFVYSYHSPDIERLSSQCSRTKIGDEAHKIHLSERAARCVRPRAQMRGKAAI
jgi:hypothetical protein